jgi:serine phosphatase RsbU (regulator of sigma subunit)/CHASE3 domain sensor protein
MQSPPPARDVVTAELRAPLFVLLIVVPVLALASAFVHQRVEATAANDHLLRSAQIDRGAALRVQLNEETGMRGYIITRDVSFLKPYLAARGRTDLAFARFERDIARTALPGAAELVAHERAINARWVAEIAKPLIADPRLSQHALALERRGKILVDTFRRLDSTLQVQIATAADAAEESSSHAVSWILIVDVVAVGILVLAALAFGYLQARAARIAFESRMLYENEKRIADALSEAFLQKELPLSPAVGLHATYVPASREAQVGGDWYDALELPDGRILFSIGDVAGHGVDAAVVMSRARQSIVAAALHENDPAAVLERANRALILQESRMVTAICGYLDPRTRDIAYATAGHPPPVLARDGYAEFLPHAGLPLGIIDDAAYTRFHARAEAGALLVLYTDGVLEHKRDLIAGEARLLDAARRSVGDANPALAIQRHVFEGSAPTDDVAILAISFRRVAPNDGEAASLSALQVNRWQPQSGASEQPDPAGIAGGSR